MNEARIPLDRSLPAEVVVGGASRWFAYRNFPAFSAPWLWRRTLLFAILVAVMSSLVVLGVGIARREWLMAFLAGGHFMTGFMVMAMAGPSLATVVRHARWPLRAERAAVVAAIVLGIGISFFADQWSSNYLKNVVGPTLEQPGHDVHVVVRQAPRAVPAPALALNLLFVLGIYGFLGGGLALRSYFGEARRLRELHQREELAALRQHSQSADLRMAVLQAQVEPHFLFNTLASVRSLIRQDPARAEHTLDALADHLRATIPRLRADQASPESTLGQQLDICSSYLVLMQVRMGPRMSFEIRVDASLMDLPFPPLMLISVVENAIKHGLEPKSGNGRIDIEARQHEGVLEVRVDDDGRGLVPGASSGIGLANIREQLKARFGDRAALSIRARESGGVSVQITVPVATGDG